jgi:hypothetical protein
MKVFTLYIGTSQPGAKETLLDILRKRFESFTVISGEGYFHGTAEPMWFVRLATDEQQKILEIAEEIRSTLQQDGVGIEYRSRYYRCTEQDPASDLSAVLESEDQGHEKSGFKPS